MTSSLVGSEMCIRDRLGRWSTPSLPWIKLSKATHGWVGGEPGLSSTMPVSYTHLTLPTICSV
eukprot:4465283-Prorocentrum_lima.AAC.1